MYAVYTVLELLAVNFIFTPSTVTWEAGTLMIIELSFFSYVVPFGASVNFISYSLVELTTLILLDT